MAGGETARGLARIAICTTLMCPGHRDADRVHVSFAAILLESGVLMLTKKGKYGLKAMVDLAQLQPGETAFITEIALRNNLPKKFLDTIMLELRNAGFLRSKKGPGGGYALARPASEIRVGQVIRTLDGPLAPIRCASRTAYEMCDDCSDPENCHVRRSMIVVRDAVANILDNMTLAQFAASEKDAADVVLAPLRSEAG
ncbi:BadM/Rrf2 family transcriptional regulator [Sinorhizobium medicae]|uniref:Transcriptional regulator, BadM/Rrf2 family n=6 Tax=Sinorhizobium TaxID=28105 RepID=A0A508X2M4_9HYPH|nr:BadM/Rrf2 family transcriptional regulator [Sinorhizobium medicae]TWA29961.1 BadM/Rrf2 family transcriptional regulator [Sinorhizobium medicae]TWA41886.1 BadM/Rrf2 family transcriptional regulator [Sinorhizobium medicae]TWA44293.1 BadM/Rrf2 family transcriptional regulator [Sinorhizobium medicae]TWA49189.1 BadM/Rrf2 family transcriptional regulator [Sinorhizobium medicae]